MSTIMKDLQKGKNEDHTTDLKQPEMDDNGQDKGNLSEERDNKTSADRQK